VNNTDIKRLSSADADFYAQLDELLAWEQVSDDQVEQSVRHIVSAIRQRGDDALLEFTQRFDRIQAGSVADLEISKFKLLEALDTIATEQREALERAASRVQAYAEHQKLESWSYKEADGTVLGQQVTPLDSAGLYVPGGKASYPSSVIMNAVPAVRVIMVISLKYHPGLSTTLSPPGPVIFSRVMLMPSPWMMLKTTVA